MGPRSSPSPRAEMIGLPRSLDRVSSRSSAVAVSGRGPTRGYRGERVPLARRRGIGGGSEHHVRDSSSGRREASRWQSRGFGPACANGLYTRGGERGGGGGFAAAVHARVPSPRRRFCPLRLHRVVPGLNTTPALLVCFVRGVGRGRVRGIAASKAHRDDALALFPPFPPLPPPRFFLLSLSLSFSLSFSFLLFARL